jgi:AcrR family transcriptional regulator
MSPRSAVPKRARSSASQRRGDVLAAAATEIAARGAIGWRTRDVATRAGISDAYLFRLYPTKRALLHEVAADAFERLAQAGTASLTVADGLLLLQLFAACPGDRELRDVARTHIRRLPEARLALGEALLATVAATVLGVAPGRHADAAARTRTGEGAAELAQDLCSIHAHRRQ